MLLCCIMASKCKDTCGNRTGLQLSFTKDKLDLFVDISCGVSRVNFTLEKWIYLRNPLGNAY